MHVLGRIDSRSYGVVPSSGPRLDAEAPDSQQAMVLRYTTAIPPSDSRPSLTSPSATLTECTFMITGGSKTDG